MILGQRSDDSFRVSAVHQEETSEKALAYAVLVAQ
jgi:hypothetical protein